MTNFLKPLLEGFATIGEGFLVIANAFRPTEYNVNKRYNETKKKYEYIRKRSKKMTKDYNSVKTYDPYDLKNSFLQVREQLCEGKAKLLSMEMKIGDPKSQFHKNNRIIFEVELYDE